jgi:anaphase-promoting complex subunit 3
VLERRGKKKEALELFERAFAISPDSPMVAFRRAKALVTLGQIQPALHALQTLVLKAPNEFNIHFLLGKLYKLTHDPANAMRSFAHALDLDPKMAAAIKLAQEPAKGSDEGEDEDGNPAGADESYRTDEGSRL